MTGEIRVSERRSSSGIGDGSFDSLVAELAAGLVVSEGGELDGGIETALRRIVCFYGADRSTLFRIGDSVAASADPERAGEGVLIATDCWARPGVPRIEGVIDERLFPWASTTLRGGESLFLDPTRGVPAEAAEDLATCRSWGIASLIAAPLVAQGRVVGVVAIGQLSRRRPWSDAERLQLAAISGLLAGAVARRRSHLELASAREGLRDAEARFRRAATTAIRAQEEERRRIARELHDDVSQRLVSLSLELELAGVSESIAAEVRGLAEVVHGHSRRLHPRLVESLGLREAIETEIASFGDRFDGRVEFIANDRRDADEIPLEIASVAFRLVQESLRNVARHAGAEVVEIRLETSEEELRLAVEDDGCGFESAATPRGLGVVSMRERVALVGGDIAFGVGPLGGTLVEARLPRREPILDGDGDATA